MLNHHQDLKLTDSIFSNHEQINSQVHAKRIDKILGFRIPKIELKLLQKYRAYDRCEDESSKKKHYQGTQTWIGLHPQALQTPYCDLYKVLGSLDELIDVNHVIDIGAAYGRVGLVLSVTSPEAKFTGYEVVKQRQMEAMRMFSKLNLVNLKVQRVNVLDDNFEIPKAEIYFIYDFSEIEDVKAVLLNLSKKRRESKFFLIAKGERIDKLMNNSLKHIWRNITNLNTNNLKVYTLKSFI